MGRILSLPTRQKVSLACFFIALGMLGVFGVLYLVTPEFLPYHAAALGVSWDEVAPEYQTLIIALIRAVAGGLLGSTAAGMFLLFIPFARGEAWARWGLLVAGLLVSVPLLWATLMVHTDTPATTPWPASLAGLVLVIAGFAASSEPSRRREATSVVPGG